MGFGLGLSRQTALPQLKLESNVLALFVQFKFFGLCVAHTPHKPLRKNFLGLCDTPEVLEIALNMIAAFGFSTL